MIRFIRQFFPLGRPQPFVPVPLADHEQFWNLVWTDPNLRSELMKTDVTLQTCFHEAGHIIAAQNRNITIREIYLNALQCNYGEPDSSVADKYCYSGVEIAGNTIKDAQRDFLLGGLFGEILAADLPNTGEKGAWVMDPERWTNDVNKLIQDHASNASVARLARRWRGSTNGKHRVPFFRDPDFEQMPEYKEFSRNRVQHAALALFLYNRWRENNFRFTMFNIGDLPR